MEAQDNKTPATVGRSAWLTLAILSSTLLAVMFSETMLLPAIPEIMQDFAIPYGTAAWIFSAYLIVAAVMTPIAGRLSDIYGKKKVLLTLIAIYIVGTVSGGFADNISFLLVSRIIQGVGLAAVPAAFSLLRDSFPPARLAIAVGVFGSAYSAGSVVGLLAGASVIQNFGWHATFFFIAPIAAVVALLIARFVREEWPPKDRENAPDKKRPSIDMMGAVALSATIISFLLGLTLVETGMSAENMPQIAAAFAGSAVSLSIFVAIERRISSPLLDLRLLKDRTLLPSYLILVSTGITMFIAYPSIVQLVRSPAPLGFGGDAIDAANVQLPFMVMFLIFASATAFIISRIGSVKPTIIGAVISLAGSLGLLMFHSTEFAVSASLAVIATGLSLTSTAVWNLIVSSAPREFIGISTGVGALLLFVGMAIGPALAGVYMEDKETIEGVAGSYPSPESYNLIFITSGLLSAASLGLALMLRKKVAGQKAIEA